MTLATHLATTSPVDPELLFLEARRVIGIPAEWPFDVGISWWWGSGASTEIRSRPDGFPTALSVSHAVGSPIQSLLDPTDVEGVAWHPEEPVYVMVKLDTTYNYEGEDGTGCDSLHRRITAALGEWLDDRGVGWFAKDEYTGTWHERTPCPLVKAALNG